MKIKSVIKTFLAALTVSTLILTTSLVTNASGRTIDFSGYNWNVKNSFFGPGPNWWTDAASDVYTDSNGALHLSIKNNGGTWYSSEVYLPSSLGYGTYSFETSSNVDNFDPNVVLGLFMYQDDTHEIDTEFSRWGIDGGPNLGHSVQPAGTKGNNYQFKIALDQTAPVINEIDWQPTKVVFRTIQNGNLIKEWTYAGADNFVPGKEFADINFWLMKGLAPINGQNAEAVINSFKFTPYVETPVVVVPAPAVIAPTPDTPTPVITPAPMTTVAPTIYSRLSRVKNTQNNSKQIIRKINKSNFLSNIKNGVKIRY
jgi:hypothetical protein